MRTVRVLLIFSSFSRFEFILSEKRSFFSELYWRSVLFEANRKSNTYSDMSYQITKFGASCLIKRVNWKCVIVLIETIRFNYLHRACGTKSLVSYMYTGRSSLNSLSNQGIYEKHKRLQYKIALIIVPDALPYIHAEYVCSCICEGHQSFRFALCIALQVVRIMSAYCIIYETNSLSRCSVLSRWCKAKRDIFLSHEPYG
jgi:hypothetical protein